MTEHTASRRTLLAGTLGGSALGGLVLASADSAEAVTIPTDPSSDFFLNIDGIPGDSTAVGFLKQIVVLDWSWGVSTAISPTNTGSGAGKSKPQPFTFVASTSSASPKLFLACAQGTHIKSAKLTARRSGEMPSVYLTITLQNLFITSYQVAPAPTDAFPLDVVQLEYGAVTVTYTKQNPSGGMPTNVTAGFDFLKNRTT
jgi:type VI secretion system secreted protein Hcp